MMTGDGPFASDHSLLMVRARVDSSVLPRFTRWYYETYRPHMLAIPGIQDAHVIVPPDLGDQRLPWLRVYEFTGDNEIQAALESPEARQARDDWAEWRDNVHDLTIEVYAPLMAMLVLHHWN